MGAMLRAVHNQCGEKPQVGKIFQVRGTDSVAVYFTVVKRTQGNKPVAGLLIATQAAPNHVEAALVSDDASRFGSTVNPMLRQLFSVWHPGGATANASAPPAKNSAPAPASVAATGGHSAAVPRLHKVTLPDNTASVSIPDGWKFNTKVSGGGTIVLEGPHGGGEGIVLNTAYSGQDPTNPGFQRARQGGFRPPPNVVFHPHNGDLVKAFPDLYLRLGRSIGWHPTDLQIDRSETMPSPQSERCVHATGHVNNFGSGMMELNEMLCTVGFDPNTGQYRFTAFFSLLPNAVADQDRATAAAIMSSFKWDEALVRARSDAEMAPILATMRKSWQAQQDALLRHNQQIVGQINQIGANATARYNATQAANDAQHAAWSQGQEDNSRNIQGFSNYLLDQTVIQDNNMYGNGTVGHGTAWNSTADTLVKANPNRFEIVESPNYWQGVDY